ncbi:MAG: hypothetical protein WAV23_03675 [Minisyncoccia bacterium]
MKDIPPKNKDFKRNKEKIDKRVLELVEGGYTKETAAKIADVEFVIMATKARREATANDPSLKDEEKEEELFKKDDVLSENTIRLGELLAEKGEKKTAGTENVVETKDTVNPVAETAAIPTEKVEKTEAEENEDIMKRINENSERIIAEDNTKFEENIKNIHEKSEKMITEAKEKFDKKMEEIKNKIDDGYKDTKDSAITEKKEITKETATATVEKKENTHVDVELNEIEKIKALKIELKAEKEKLKNPIAKVEDTKISEKKPEEKVVEKVSEQVLLAQLNNARIQYADGYKKFLADRKKDSSWYKNLGRKIFGSKVTESETPQYLKDLEKEYEKNTIEYGKNMYSEKEAELKNSKLTSEQQKTELKRYKGNEIFTKVIAEEQIKLNALKAENLPLKEKALWRQGMDWYLKQPRWKKIAISTALSTAAIAAFLPSSIAAGGVTATYLGTKYARALTGSFVGQGASYAYDWLLKSKSAENREMEERNLAKQFSEESFDTSFAKNKKEFDEISEKERKAKRERLITKALITVAAGGIASYEMGNVLHTISPEQALANGDLQKSGAGGHGTVKIDNAPETPKAPEIKIELKTESVDYSSRGAIQTIHDLKTQISHDYPDISKAPASVQEFMKTDSTQEAIRLGMYNPNSPAESMTVQKGTLSFENGTLKTHYLDMKGVEHDQVLIKGADVEQFKGDMFNSDHQGQHAGSQEGSTHATPEDGEIDQQLEQNQVSPAETPAIDEHLKQNQVNPTETQAQNTASGKHIPESPIEPTGEILQSLLKQHLEQAHLVRAENINHLFGKNTTLWDNVKNSHSPSLTADKMMHLKTEGMTEDTKKLVSYLNKLHEVTGLSPLEETLVSAAETNDEFITRSLEKAAEMGVLDEVKL